MPRAYYARAAGAEFWSEHWGHHSVAELLAIARRSPLTDLILEALPADGCVLEAGCGLGQYVILLRERGWRVVGVDWSLDALREARHAGGVPLAASELRTLAVRDGSVAAYVSLGVVEHDPAGPEVMLREAHRVLRSGGRLIVSVPYLNGVRRVLAPYQAWANWRIRARGGEFYQFAFTPGEMRRCLEAAGFVVGAVRPYDPARLPRQVLRALGLARRHRGGASRTGVAGPRNERSAPAPRRPLVAAAQGLLYTRAMLALLAHMVLLVAVKR
jgi:SAM-dependent methyltransferase